MFIRHYNLLGPIGVYLALCRKIKYVPFPVSVPIFGTVSTLAEVMSIRENFVMGCLRDPRIETTLRNTPNPVVVDCGVNIGATVRWWFHCNPHCRVFGVDMMQEAIDLIRQRLNGGQENYVGIKALLSSNDGDEVTIRFRNPLDSWNRIGNTRPGGVSRTLRTARLDTLLAPHSLSRVDLLKLDLEGHGARALIGAARTLAATQHVILEQHSEEEIGDATALLLKNSFRLRRTHVREMWFQRVN
jgi:FkbM family methyltransferase